MCGRYTLSRPGQVPSLFEISEVRLPPRFNIAPAQQAPVVRTVPSGRTLDLLRWGLIPHWVREPSAAKGLINARSETAWQKPSFRDSFRSRRCLVPADGFYEWSKAGGGKGKIPHLFSLKDGDVFAFAGLWDHAGGASETPQTFAILTCEANELVRSVHPRMPVILHAADFSEWLSPAAPSSRLRQMLVPYRAEEMRGVAVSAYVNSPRNDDPQCMEPTADTLEGLFG